MSPRVAMIYGSLYGGGWGKAGQQGEASGGGSSWDGTLYSAGDEMTDITGGWTGSRLTKEADYLQLTSGTSYGGTGEAITTNTVDLTDWATVEVNVTRMDSGARGYLRARSAGNSNLASVQFSGTGLKSLDISGVTEPCYVQIVIQNTGGVGSNPTMRFDNVKLGR